MSSKLAVVTGTLGQLGPIWCRTLEGMGYRIFGIDQPLWDVADRDQMHYAARRCYAIHGAPEGVVLNAAIDNPPGSDAKFFGNMERILAVNLLGANYVAEAFIPRMIENGGGVIIGIVSIMGRIGADWRNYPDGFEKPCAYGQSKAALEAMSRQITVQYGRYGIRACCIGFGPFDGGKLDPVFIRKFLRNVPVGRPVSEASVAAALRFAVECPEFAGQTALIDGGYTIL